MRKSLTQILFLATTLGLAGSTLCYADDDGDEPEKAATTDAASPQPSHREMHRMTRTETSSSNHEFNAERGNVQGRPDGPPNPSQRSMRQKLKETTSNSPATEEPAEQR